MIFEDVSGNTIRIPDERLCGIKRDGNCYLWCLDNDEVHKVTSFMFYACIEALGDKHFVNSRGTPNDKEMSDEEYKRRLTRSLIDITKEGI